MRDCNEAHIIGRAGKDGVLSYTASGKALGKFSLATGGGKRKDGGADYPTDWHNITAWGDAAERLVPIVKKGQWVEVVGRISYSKSEKGGVTRYYTDIVASKISFPEGEEREYQVDRGAAAPILPGRAEYRPPVTQEITDEDIPF